MRRNSGFYDYVSYGEKQRINAVLSNKEHCKFMQKRFLNRKCRALACFWCELCIIQYQNNPIKRRDFIAGSDCNKKYTT